MVVCGAANLALATERYVSLAGSNDAAGGYTNWAGAATGLQDAVSAAWHGTRILVTNGVYALGAPVEINVGLTLSGVNAPSNAVLDGQNARRCVLGFGDARGWLHDCQQRR